MLSVVALVGTAGAACFFCRARVSAREGWEGWKRRVKGPREVRGVARTWPRQWGVQARGVAWRGRRMGEGLPVMVLTRERGAQEGPRGTQRGQKRDATRGADSAMGATRCKKSLQKAAAWPLRSLSVCLSVCLGATRRAWPSTNYGYWTQTHAAGAPAVSSARLPCCVLLLVYALCVTEMRKTPPRKKYEHARPRQWRLSGDEDYLLQGVAR